jgi:prepilin-type N-terminal cleavage/methylation domain-containing protein
MSKRNRQGFTLIELLVVIAIIAILIALLLPAVQQAREAARRSQCKNKLKQIALALHNYHDNALAMPPGVISNQSNQCSGGSGNRRGAPWTVMVLPYMEQSTLYQSANFDLDFPFDNRHGVGGVNKTLWLRQNPDYQCPSNPNSQSGANNLDYMGVEGGGTRSQAACTASCCGGTTYFFKNGIFYLNSTTRMADITDGTSNVFLLGETKYQLRPGGRPGDGTRYFSWASSDRGNATRVHSVMAAAVIQINEWDGDGSKADTGYTAGAFPLGQRNLQGHTFGSFHVGGCHFAVADGSVRFVSEFIDITNYRRLAGRYDGEPVGAF